LKKKLTTLLLITYGLCSGQNLVPNGDFEDYWGCPNWPSQIDTVKFWFMPTLGNSDYFNQCASFGTQVSVPNNQPGFQQPHSGVGYVGGSPWWLTLGNNREYIEVELDSVLSSGVCYQFKMYISSGDYCKYTTFEIGAYFSNTIITGINNATYLPYSPQINNSISNYPDTSNWTLVSGNFNAVGGESYLIIGNFKNDNNTTTTVTNSNATNNGAYFYIDDVSLERCDLTGLSEENEFFVNVFPNPLKDKLTVNINHNEFSEIILYDITSGILVQQTFTNTTTINTEQLAKGIYFYTLRNRNGIIKNGKVIKQ
jgi:hypothetical protein